MDWEMRDTTEAEFVAAMLTGRIRPSQYSNREFAWEIHMWGGHKAAVWWMARTPEAAVKMLRFADRAMPPDSEYLNKRQDKRRQWRTIGGQLVRSYKLDTEHLENICTHSQHRLVRPPPLVIATLVARGRVPPSIQNSNTYSNAYRSMLKRLSVSSNANNG